MEEENRQYIAHKLKGIIEPMIAQLLVHKPKDTTNFMLEWLESQRSKTHSNPYIE